ncbi:MAG: SoxR reducing system RseC family protein, partial [Odoribacter sp.]|nr:SoxR reducing system RseC family protein [Odoribacter sp.]
ITEIPDFEVKTGDKVEVNASIKNAMFSVVMAYVIPAILLIAIVFILSGYGASELVAATGALIGVFLYYVALYFCRRKLSRKIKFTIEKKD